MPAEDVLVIGAGPAGLAVSACLRREGVAHEVLERERAVAPAWQRHYDRLHLHTIASYSALPMTPWPAGTPRYPSREQVLQYLQAYAAEHRVTPRLGVEATALRREGERFRVDTSAGVARPRAVVVATGCNAVPTLPAIPGHADFRGRTLHAGAYRHAAPFRGQRVLVVGCGNSGAEIALDLAEQGVAVAMVVRGPVHVVPRDLLGLWPSQHVNVLLSVLPLALRDAIARVTVDRLVGDLSRWGIVRPALGINRMIEDSGRIPILDLGTIAMVRQGRIRVLPAVERVLPDGVRVAGGATHPFDALIYATGYAAGLDVWIDGYGAIADARGRPRRVGAETDIPGLYFVGFRNPSTGALREIALEAPRVARAIRARG